MLKQFLEIGKVTGTHGVRGDLRVEPWADSPDFLTKFRILYLDAQGTASLKVSTVRPHGHMVILHAVGIDTIEQAETLRGKILYMNRTDADLPAGTYFIQDLIGCKVLEADTEVTLGTLTDITTGVANPYWTVTNDGKDYLVPAVASVVVGKDPEHGTVTIRPMKGIFDDED